MKPLKKSELKLVAGGYGSSTITVTGTRYSSSSTSGWSTTSGWTTSNSSSSWTTYSSSYGSSTSADNDTDENQFETLADAKAALVEAIKAKVAADGLTGTNQPEYGALIYKNADGTYTIGEIVTGESYNDHNPPRTHLSLDEGRSYSDVVGVIHSHPPSGDSDTDTANETVSDNDEAALQALVDQGADPNELVFVIIDKDGNVDEKQFSDI